MCCSACLHNEGALFIDASMRKYGPCHAFRTLLEDKLGQTTVVHPILMGPKGDPNVES